MATPVPDFTPEQQAYIDDLRNAMRSEFESSESDRKPTIKELEDLEQDALDALRHTLRHSDNESIKSKVAMWTVSTLLDAKKVGHDPLVAFLEGMKDKRTSATHS